MHVATIDTSRLIDIKNARQHKSLYHDEAIYQAELDRIFGRCWLFLAQDNLIPDAGDYLVTFMGADEVVVVRQRDGSVRAFLNYCMHRGSRVVVAEAGNARGFTCNYHGWAYGLDGKLEVLPLEKEAYGCLEKASHGLREVRVENYHGFYYGTFDKDAPNFREYLGDMAWYYDIWFEHTGGMELIGPPTRTLLETNWKMTAENFAGDVYHAPWSHANYFMAHAAAQFGDPGEQKPPEGIQVTTRYGHGAGILHGIGATSMGRKANALVADWYAQHKPDMIKRLGEVRGKYYDSHVDTTIFPNNSFLFGSHQFKVWQPRGPHALEIVTWAMVEKNWPTEMKEVVAEGNLRAYAAAGTVEVEDADNLETAAALTRGPQTRNGWMNAQLGMGQEVERPEEPGVIAPVPMSEICHRGFYRAYKDYMDHDSWDQIRAASAGWKQQLLPR